MDNQRLFLFFALALVLMFIWQAWEQQNTPPPTSTVPAVGAPAITTPGGVPAPPEQAITEQTKAPKITEVLPRGMRIRVSTDVIDAVIDTEGEICAN